MPTIEFGTFGWKHPEAKGIVFGSSQNALDWGTRESKPGNPIPVDTRPTLGEVYEQLVALENAAMELSAKESKYRVGPWEEYFHLSSHANSATEKWPHGYFHVAAYVVTGGNEGLYLHVDLILRDDRRRNLFLGKTLDCSQWEACWLSAARIAHFLGA